MAGITHFGGYVPLYRMGPKTSGWSSSGERAVANFDEDSITMAVAAALDCLKSVDRSVVDALYMASDTLPYEEKQAATLVATAADLSPDIFSSDVGHSLRSGTLALTMAIDAAKAGRVSHALVVASDCRLGAPGSDFEKSTGDGAVCFVIGEGDEIAVLEDVVSVTNEINDVWRAAGETTIRSWEDRFVQQEGYLASIERVVALLKARTGRSIDSFDRVVLYAPDARRHAEAARLLGISTTHLQGPLFNRLGNTGSAFAPMQLAAALEEAQPGEMILVLNYGDGADALVFRVTDRIVRRRAESKSTGISGHLASSLPVPSYQHYLKWRGFLSADTGVRRPGASGPSAAALHREQEQVLRFHGVKCHSCGTSMYPPQRICVSCNKLDESDPVRLVGVPAKLFTYSMDYIAGTTDIPLVLTVIDFANGARAVLMMTDREVERIAIEMDVDVTFRLGRSGGGIANYYWKSMPLRESFVSAPVPA